MARSPDGVLDLTEEMLTRNVDPMMALATAAAAERPLQATPGPKPVAPVFPSPPPAKAAPAAPYAHREVKVITTPSGGFGVIVGQELIGVAEGPARLQTLLARWAEGT